MAFVVVWSDSLSQPLGSHWNASAGARTVATKSNIFWGYSPKLLERMKNFHLFWQIVHSYFLATDGWSVVRVPGGCSNVSKFLSNRNRFRPNAIRSLTNELNTFGFLCEKSRSRSQCWVEAETTSDGATVDASIECIFICSHSVRPLNAVAAFISRFKVPSLIAGTCLVSVFV